MTEVECKITKMWVKKGTDTVHREDGPAIEFTDGTKAWYQHGELHRLDGPAVELVNVKNIGGIKESKYQRLVKKTLKDLLN